MTSPRRAGKRRKKWLLGTGYPWFIRDCKKSEGYQTLVLATKQNGETAINLNTHNGTIGAWKKYRLILEESPE